MKLFHLSHTDLDGYACQLLTNEYFDNAIFYNANYGLEVKLSLKKLLEDIVKFPNEKIFIMISDLNLTLNESKELENQINLLRDDSYDIKLQLLDHHITGSKCADKFSWYYLDDKRCATKIVYEYLQEEFDAFSQVDKQWLSPLVDAVNAVDIWLDYETKNFEFGKVMMSLISKAREVNSVLFPDLNRDYKLYLLKKASNYLDDDKGYISLDNSIHKLKKEYLNSGLSDDTIDNLSAKYLVLTLDSIKEDLTIYYKKHKGLLTYCLGSISIPANAFLKANQDYDFFIDINKKGNASFRADGNIDVSLLAQKIANGGGHKNASGARFEDFKESIDYYEIKSYIQKKLNNLK